MTRKYFYILAATFLSFNERGHPLALIEETPERDVIGVYQLSDTLNSLSVRCGFGIVNGAV